MQLATFNQKLQNLDDFERDEADAYLWGAVLLNEKDKRNDHMLHYKLVFGNVFESRESKCCAVLMKQPHKVKGGQMIIL